MTGGPAGPAMRLQKFLARAGVASRRKAEALIVAGRVRVNGEPVTTLGTSVDPGRDTVEVDGRRVTLAEPVWIALHKPRGYVTARHDPRGRPTVYDLLPPGMRTLFHVGRLDYDSEGLLLLTNEGDVAHRLLHPRFGAERVYDVVVEGEVGDDALAALRSGVPLEDGPARVHAARRLRAPSPGASAVRVTMREGRKREVRRLFEAVGFPVRRLVRRRYGPVSLGRLRPGEWRRLTPAERAALPGAEGAPRPRRRGPGGRRGRGS